MSAKPTPGPYTIEHDHPGTICAWSRNYDFLVCQFRYAAKDGEASLYPKQEEAEANARAWVEGIAALETLQRIKNVAVLNMLDAEDQMDQIVKILDEAKP